MTATTDRTGDNRWNQCLDALIAAWNRAGPDATLGALRDLELSDGKDAARGTGGREPLWAAAERARAEGRIGPLPRMPAVRPESDYEMNPPEVMP